MAMGVIYNMYYNLAGELGLYTEIMLRNMQVKYS